MQSVSGFVCREQVKAIGKDLAALNQSVGADDDRLRLFSIKNSAGANGDIWIGLANFVAPFVCEDANLFFDNLLPIHSCFVRRFTEQLYNIAHNRESHLVCVNSK